MVFSREGGDPNPKWWTKTRLYLDANAPIISGVVLPRDCIPVSQCEHIGETVHRQRTKELFTPPLLVASRGFGKVAFCDFPILFQHALRSISPASEDPAERKRLTPIIAFLTLFLRSKLARYYLFHTSANWATERDQINLFELLRLPFPLPGDPSLPTGTLKLFSKPPRNFSRYRRKRSVLSNGFIGSGSLIGGDSIPRSGPRSSVASRGCGLSGSRPCRRKPKSLSVVTLI